MIKVEGARFPYVSFEDRARPRVGDWVIAVGNPFGLGGTATAGIVSALGRRNVSDSSYVDYMQIDAPINRGNSGGPTFDVDGRVVGSTPPSSHLRAARSASASTSPPTWRPASLCS